LADLNVLAHIIFKITIYNI